MAAAEAETAADTAAKTAAETAANTAGESAGAAQAAAEIAAAKITAAEIAAAETVAKIAAEAIVTLSSDSEMEVTGDLYDLFNCVSHCICRTDARPLGQNLRLSAMLHDPFVASALKAINFDESGIANNCFIAATCSAGVFAMLTSEQGTSRTAGGKCAASVHVVKYDVIEHEAQQQSQPRNITDRANGRFALSPAALMSGLARAQSYIDNPPNGATTVPPTELNRKQRLVVDCGYSHCTKSNQNRLECANESCTKKYHVDCTEKAAWTRLDGCIYCDICVVKKAESMRKAQAKKQAAQDKQRETRADATRKENTKKAEADRLARAQQAEADRNRDVLVERPSKSLVVAGRAPEALALSAPVQAADAGVTGSFFLDVLKSFSAVVAENLKTINNVVVENNRHSEALHSKTVDGNVLIHGHVSGLTGDAHNATPETKREKKRRFETLQAVVLAEQKADRKEKKRKLRRVAREAERVAAEAAVEAAQAAAKAAKAVSCVSDTYSSDESDASEDSEN
jgi:hypothetical protein